MKTIAAEPAPPAIEYGTKVRIIPGGNGEGDGAEGILVRCRLDYEDGLSTVRLAIPRGSIFHQRLPMSHLEAICACGREHPATFHGTPWPCASAA